MRLLVPTAKVARMASSAMILAGQVENQEHGGAETGKFHNPHRRLRPIFGRKRHGFSGLGLAPAKILSFVPVVEPPVSVEPRNAKHSEECEPLDFVQQDEHFAGVSFSF